MQRKALASTSLEPERPSCRGAFGAALGCLGLLLGTLACAGKDHGAGPAPSPAPLPSISLFTGASYVLEDQQALLQWQVAGATSLTLDQGVGAVSGTTTWVRPTTTYTLTATNAAGSTTATCTLSVWPAQAGTTATLSYLPFSPLVDGPGAYARFQYPTSLGLDASGNVFVADSGNQALRMISPQGLVSTPLPPFPLLAGVDKVTPEGTVTTLPATLGFQGSVNPQSLASDLYAPTGVALDGDGNVYALCSGTILQITPAGIANPVPRIGPAETMNWLGWGLAFMGGQFFSIAPYGVEVIGGFCP